MKRPIDREGADRRAVMWRDDKYARGWDVTEVSRALHRYAGKAHSLSCNPKLSAVDKRYFAEINRYHGHGRSDFNIAMGTGPDPVLASLVGYALAAPGDPMWNVFALEHECERLRRSIVASRDRERRLDRVLDTLADLVQAAHRQRDTLFNRMVAAAPRTVAELAASNTEDDDL